MLHLPPKVFSAWDGTRAKQDRLGECPRPHVDLIPRRLILSICPELRVPGVLVLPYGPVLI